MSYGFREMTLGMWETATAERRAEERTRVEIPARLTDVFREGLPVTVVNVSPSGLGVKVEDKFKVGLPVIMECEGLLILGNVRHCLPAEGGYLLGIKIHKIIDMARVGSRVAM